MAIHVGSLGALQPFPHTWMPGTLEERQDLFQLPQIPQSG